MHRPVCTECEVEFLPIQNGVDVVDYSKNGPLQVSEADEFQCPECEHRIIIGFGNPYAQRHGTEPSTSEAVARALGAGSNRMNYRTPEIKKEALECLVEESVPQPSEYLTNR